MFGHLVPALLAGLMLGTTAVAQTVERTAGMGVALIQDGRPVPLEDDGSAYAARLDAKPFDLQVAVFLGDGMMVALSPAPDLFERYLSDQETVFGLGFAYARYPNPGEPLYLSDPACLTDAMPTGFNMLGPEHATVRGTWPVTAIEADRGSDDCRAPDALPRGTSLIAPGRTLYMIVSDGEAAEFIVLRFDGPPAGA